MFFKNLTKTQRQNHNIGKFINLKPFTFAKINKTKFRLKVTL